ncbi:PqiC family protein [Amphibiibacter pelophylacis]|uniref:PqiC family protein n=1 Tax=Amphibiibacter pelophylacis TaxID=1799477 RepID=A0ACC6NZM6_9BURK
MTPGTTRFLPTRGLTLASLAAATALLTACASTPSADSGPVSYRLDLCAAPTPATAAGTVAAQAMQTVQILPVALDGALDQTGVAVQTSPVSLSIAQRHLWASPLPEQLSQRLAQGLQQRLDAQGRAVRVVASSALLPASGPAPWRLAVEVSHFEGLNAGDQAGSARVSGRWTLMDASGVRASRAFDTTQPLAQAGYPALVQALSCAWQQQAAAVAQTVAQAVTSRP